MTDEPKRLRRCKWCGHWSERDPGGELRKECRREAPKLIIISSSEAPTDQVLTKWPQTEPDEWCSQWTESHEEELETFGDD